MACMIKDSVWFENGAQIIHPIKAMCTHRTMNAAIGLPGFVPDMVSMVCHLSTKHSMDFWLLTLAVFFF
jgi:hypothetical protein